MQVSNQLYPVFLKLENLKILIIGGGAVGYEKLFFILKNSPTAHITLIATKIDPEIHTLLLRYPETKVNIIERDYVENDLKKSDIIIAAVNCYKTSETIHHKAKSAGKLINTADTPDLCDFYLGSIVSRGNLKIAISTNGTSPILAKRIRQVLEDCLPNDMNELLLNLNIIRNKLTGNFKTKLEKLNTLTASLIADT